MSNLIKETSRGYDVMRAEDLLMTSGKVFLSDEVTSETIDELLKNLMVLESDENVKEVSLYINSPGGSVPDGLRIYDYIQSMQTPVTTIVCGTAYSMAAIIFLASNSGRRLIYPSSKCMLHDPSYGSADIGGKKPHELQSQVDKLMETRKTLAEIISKVTGKSLDEVYEITREDRYYNAEESVSEGLATQIIMPSNNNISENSERNK